MVGRQENRIASLDRVGKSFQMPTFAIDDSIMECEVSVYQAESLNEPWPGMAAMGWNKSVGFVCNQIHDGSRRVMPLAEWSDSPRGSRGGHEKAKRAWAICDENQEVSRAMT